MIGSEMAVGTRKRSEASPDQSPKNVDGEILEEVVGQKQKQLRLPHLRGMDGADDLAELCDCSNKIDCKAAKSADP